MVEVVVVVVEGVVVVVVVEGVVVVEVVVVVVVRLQIEFRFLQKIVVATVVI